MAIDNIKQMYLGHRKVSTLIHLTKRWLPLQKTVQKVAGLDWSNDIVENFQLNIKESESCHCISHDMQTNTTYSSWKKSCMISIYNNKFFLSHPCNILLVVQKKKNITKGTNNKTGGKVRAAKLTYWQMFDRQC